MARKRNHNPQWAAYRHPRHPLPPSNPMPFPVYLDGAGSSHGNSPGIRFAGRGG
jgi:hypothetical protein